MKANENTDIELDFLIARGIQDDYPTFLPEFREEFSGRNAAKAIFRIFLEVIEEMAVRCGLPGVTV